MGFRLNLETRAWYLDSEGRERECVVVKGAGLANEIVAVLDLEGEPLDIDPGSLYYVPQGEKEGE